ncbi:MAG: tetratricopeptide repeat protein [Acidobacteriota bacterium]|nr:tetratricopeptide repeat protein [Acidobacteriota bacterium]
MRINNHRFLAAVLLLAASIALPAQEGRGNGRLTGTVVDDNGAPLENATITLKYMEYNNSRQTKSNAKGQWGFLGLGKGTVQVTGEMEGYAASVTQQPVSGAKPNPEIRIVLKKGTGVAGDPARDTILRANELFDQRQYAEALALYQEFAQKNPANYQIGIYIANCKTELGNYEEAMAEYQKVLAEVTKETPELKGNATAALVFAGIGDVYLRQENFKLAVENFQRSIDIQPGDPALPYNVAEIMFARNKVDEAEKYYTLATQIKPEWPKPYLKLAYVAMNRGQMDKAVGHLTKFCEIGKDDPKFSEGQALLELLQKK